MIKLTVLKILSSFSTGSFCDRHFLSLRSLVILPTSPFQALKAKNAIIPHITRQPETHRIAAQGQVFISSLCWTQSLGFGAEVFLISSYLLNVHVHLVRSSYGLLLLLLHREIKRSSLFKAMLFLLTNCLFELSRTIPEYQSFYLKVAFFSLKKSDPFLKNESLIVLLMSGWIVWNEHFLWWNSLFFVKESLNVWK